MTKLFDPYDLAGLSLPNRVVMAPMTRSRAIHNVPDASTALYYGQRASAGLIITEGSPVSPEGRGYLYTPGIYDDAQVAGWRLVTDAVHAAGGRIFIQLWHVGRISHASLQPGGGAPVSSSAKVCETSDCFAYDAQGVAGKVGVTPPRALATDEVRRVTADFVRAGKLAMQAGFDGVEIHGANGYLFEQFINASVNDRNDEYGGSIENRLRFTLETLDAVSAAIGADKVGIRIAPFGRLYEMKPFAGEAATWLALAQEFDARRMAYVHLSDQLHIGAASIPPGFAHRFRSRFAGTLMAAGGFTCETGEAALESGDLDLIAFGRPFISNPDLVERMRNGWEIAPALREDYYGQTNRGYTDYPTWQEQRHPAKTGA